LVAARPAADAATSTSARSRPAGLRECVKGQQVSYTNVECSPGHQELAVTAAPVNALPATPVSKPAESSSGPFSLHKALDLTRDDTLRESGPSSGQSTGAAEVEQPPAKVST